MPDTAELARLAREGGRLGIDTEFMAEGRYRALLCLVQVSADDPDADDGVRTALLDPLDGGFDHGPLAGLLADPDVEIIMHAGRQDAAILRRAWSTELRNVFDTQIAAGFAGLGAQTGYANVLAQLLGVRLNKSGSFTRWDQRPLTDEQREYARGDVLHLLRLRDALGERLTVSGRLEWVREECRRLEEAGEERDPDEAYRRLPRIGQLGSRDRAVARALAAWRERTASAEDKPVNTVLPDQSLVEAARRKPRSVEALRQIRGIQPSHVRRRGEDVVRAIEQGLADPPLAAEATDRAPSNPADVPVIALAEALVRHRTQEAELAYELVASRADLQAVVRAVRTGDPDPDVRTLRGWRRDLAGDELLALLRGGRAVRVAGGALRVEEHHG